MTKNINQLAVGDTVTEVAGTVLAAPLTVTRIKGSPVPMFIILEGGRFWPTGRTDPRTCVVV